MNTKMLRLCAALLLIYGSNQHFVLAQTVPETAPGAGAGSPADSNTAKDSATETSIPHVTVTGKALDRRRNGISVDTGSSIYKIDSKDIAAMPLGDDLAFNQVMLRTPGVAQDSFGQLHVRGDHGNLQYRLNGILLPESISGFGQTLDTHFIDTVSLLTGALPAQYGYRTAGVIDLHTKSGELGIAGEVSTEFGSNGTRSINTDISGATDRFSYYLNASALSNDLGIENPTAERSAIHDHTSQQKQFAYLSYLIDQDSRLNLVLGNAINHFQIPNSPNQIPSYTLDNVNAFPSNRLDERQNETTRYAILSYQSKLGEKLDYQVSVFNRYSQAEFFPDVAGDLIYTGVAGHIDRSGRANGVQLDASYALSARHTLRFGLNYTRELLSNNNQSLTFPIDAAGNVSTTPIKVSDTSDKTSSQTGMYLQDEWKLTEQVTINYGARADWVNAYVKDQAFSPRIGIVYQPTADTTIHAGYASYFTPPPNELIADKTITAFQNTTNAAVNTQNDPIQAERTHYLDLGVSQRINKEWNVGIDAYYKQVKNLLDEGQFGSALLFTPFNYEQGKIYGVELTANYHSGPLAAYANLARSSALGKHLISSQYLFGNAEQAYIGDHWIHLDHDQTWSGSTGISYTHQGTTYSADALFGTGLRKAFANTDHLPAYTTINASIQHSFTGGSLGDWSARVSVVNLLDRVYEIRDGSGVGVGAPQWGQRRGVYLGLSKQF